MRRKRLQHVADTLCHMFCGWRLTYDKTRLVELGSGILEIDVLTKDCQFDSAAIEPLAIATSLDAWLLEDLAAHSIPKDRIEVAKLEARLAFSVIQPSERTKAGAGDFYVHGRSHESVDWHRCQIACASDVVSGDAVYTSSYSDTEEWPLGWPAA